MGQLEYNKSVCESSEAAKFSKSFKGTSQHQIKREKSEEEVHRRRCHSHSNSSTPEPPKKKYKGPVFAQEVVK